jgi:hypothetical protein
MLLLEDKSYAEEVIYLVQCSDSHKQTTIHIFIMILKKWIKYLFEDPQTRFYTRSHGIHQWGYLRLHRSNRLLDNMGNARTSGLELGSKSNDFVS